jgi:heme/copper-type cytochrome/quinol oxidase subunit 2
MYESHIVPGSMNNYSGIPKSPKNANDKYSNLKFMIIGITIVVLAIITGIGIYIVNKNNEEKNSAEDFSNRMNGLYSDALKAVENNE